VINPFDMYAIEEGIRLKERLGGKVTVISMGPPQAEESIREAISMGIDEGILVSDRAFAGSDTWATSYTLSQVIKKIANYNLIICGKQASDGDTAQVGPGISAHLDIPQVAYVKKIEDINDSYAKVERMTEEGYEVIKTPLPALFTVVKEINEPRVASLKNLMRAKKAVITKWTATELNLDPKYIGINGSPTQVVKIFTPPRREGGQVFEGTSEELAEKLVGLLKDEL
jgi:electron transfer flavoprotein beta subunit